MRDLLCISCNIWWFKQSIITMKVLWRTYWFYFVLRINDIMFIKLCNVLYYVIYDFVRIFKDQMRGNNK